MFDNMVPFDPISDDECNSSEYYDDNAATFRRCVRKKSVGAWCSTDKMCVDGSKCNLGYCTKKCKDRSDCPSDSYVCKLINDYDVVGLCVAESSPKNNLAYNIIGPLALLIIIISIFFMIRACIRASKNKTTISVLPRETTFPRAFPVNITTLPHQNHQTPLNTSSTAPHFPGETSSQTTPKASYKTTDSKSHIDYGPPPEYSEATSYTRSGH
jgi:hypothetical protein